MYYKTNDENNRLIVTTTTITTTKHPTKYFQIFHKAIATKETNKLMTHFITQVMLCETDLQHLFPKDLILLGNYIFFG
jgi:hypothetical protein